jgi:ferritin-like metal-binding protein YciE
MAKISKKKLPSLKDLFIYKLKSLYDIEMELIKALPKMAKAATDTEFKDGFEKHLEETKEHVARIEQAFTDLNIDPDTVKVAGIRGLIADTEKIIKEIEVGTVRDAGLVAAGIEAEQYEIAAYGAAIEWADLLEYADIKESFEQTLAEEQNTADTLIEAGANGLYEEALGSDENTEEGDAEDEV